MFSTGNRQNDEERGQGGESRISYPLLFFEVLIVVMKNCPKGSAQPSHEEIGASRTNGEGDLMTR
jgi:hypothetical protein